MDEQQHEKCMKDINMALDQWNMKALKHHKQRLAKKEVFFREMDMKEVSK